MRASGVIFPGLPGIILGHNDFGAWGATTSGWDTTDVLRRAGEHIPGWIRGEVFELRSSRESVAQNAVRRVRFSP